MRMTQVCRRTLCLSIMCASIVLATSGCLQGPSQIIDADVLRAPGGLDQWQREDEMMRGGVRMTQQQYLEEKSLELLKRHERSVREYLDHGFMLYRSYRAAKLPVPAALVPSLEQRTGLLMDVAEAYITHGSLAVGEGIAADVVHNYADLPAMTPAQRRAEAVLMRYRYRSDY